MKVAISLGAKVIGGKVLQILPSLSSQAHKPAVADFLESLRGLVDRVMMCFMMNGVRFRVLSFAEHH